MPKNQIVPAPDDVESVIRTIRGHRVILDADIAALYGVSTGRLNEQVKRNLGRFPEDFLFQLNQEETANLISQNATSSWGGRRKRPYAFTEHGVTMLANVLKSPRAVETSVAIVRTFVRLRQALGATSALARRINALEQRYDAKFKSVFDAIRSLMMPSGTSKKKIGFRNE